MNSSCPFMAMHCALDLKDNETSRNKVRVMEIACPFSGRKLEMEHPYETSENKDMLELEDMHGDSFSEIEDREAVRLVSCKEFNTFEADHHIQRHSSGGRASSLPPSVSSKRTRRSILVKMRGSIRTKAPPFCVEQMCRFAPIVKQSWARVLSAISWDQLGLKLYETIFEVAPQLQYMFCKSTVIMGIKMVDMIDSMVNHADDLEEVHRKMESLGPVHFKNGVQAAVHMPVFQHVVSSLLAGALQNHYTSGVVEAWEWFWDRLTDSMQVVEIHFSSSASVIQETWHRALQSLSLEEIEKRIYETLFVLAPNLQTIFTKPQDIMAMKLVNIIAMLVSLSESPDMADEVMRDLGKRHVVYGVSSSMIPVMKGAIIMVLEQLLGDSWTTNTAKVWNELWDFYSNALMKAIDEARNYGTAVDLLWSRMGETMTKRKFAAQFYTHVTSVDPELVLVFTQAGTMSPKADDDAEDLDSVQSKQQDKHGGVAFERAADQKSHRKSSLTPPDENSFPVQQKSESRRRRKSQKRVSVESISAMFSGRQVEQEPVEHDKVSSGSTLFQPFKQLAGLALACLRPILASQQCCRKVAEGSQSSPSAKVKLNRLAWGLEIWDLVAGVIELMYEPELQKQRLSLAGVQFVKCGSKPAHLKTIGIAIQRVMSQSGIAWTDFEKAAWDWFWGHVETNMRCTMDAYEKDVTEVVRGDWTAIRATHSTEAFGEIFYSEMQEVSSELLQYFVRPKRVQCSTFIAFMDMLVAFPRDQVEFYDKVKVLAVRHVKYGIKADSIKTFGVVLMRVLRRALGEQFCERSQDAWEYVWISVSRCMADCINIGSNLITMALVSGKVAELERAVSLAPRGQRADWITRVQIHSCIISPIYWAICDGKVDMVRVMIRDLLTIRADRDTYYYGCDEMWRAHPDIVMVLCKVYPELLEELFDGLLWHSANVEHDQVRVNYYLRDFYGNPDDFPDAWDSPFGTLAVLAPWTAFSHPLVKKVLSIKWEGFGFRWFLIVEGWYTMVLVLFDTAFVFHDQHSCATWPLRLTAGMVGLITLILQVVLVVSQVWAGQVGRVVLLGVAHVSMPRFLHTRWNWLRMASMAMLAIVGLCDQCFWLDILQQGVSSPIASADANVAAKSKQTTRSDRSLQWTVVSHIDTATAINAILLGTGLFQLFTVSDRLSAFTYSVGIIASDIPIFGIIIMAFATALARVEGTDSKWFYRMDVSAYTLLQHLFKLDQSSLDLHGFGGVIFIIFCLLMTIGMVDILIAQLIEHYMDLANKFTNYAILHRINLTMDIESCVPFRY